MILLRTGLNGIQYPVRKTGYNYLFCNKFKRGGRDLKSLSYQLITKPNSVYLSVRLTITPRYRLPTMRARGAVTHQSRYGKKSRVFPTRDALIIMSQKLYIPPLPPPYHTVFT